MRFLVRLIVGVSLVSAVPGLAAAQAELTGTYIRYAGMGSNGTLINSSNHSFQYTDTGSSPYSCDAFYPGSPVEEVTVEATSSSGTLIASNTQSTSSITTVSGPAVSGRTIRWTGRYTSGSSQITVAQELAFESTAKHATLTVTLTNSGSTSLSNVYYMRNADPDHGSCTIGSDTSTYNDVRRQPPTYGSALVTARQGSPSVVLGIGSHDTRARVHAGGFNNTDASGTWASPLDPAGALDDIGMAIAFRESSLSIGASTTFVIHYVFGSSESAVESRFDTLSGPTCGSCDDGNPCTLDSCVSGTCAHDPATGASCDDGMWCTTSDACTSAGTCRGVARSCDDGDLCTSDRCDEASDACVNTVSDGCTIAGACVAEGATRPGNPCEACVPSVSTTSWSPLSAGTACGEALCEGGVWSGERTCDGSGTCSAAESMACPTGACASAMECEPAGPGEDAGVEPGEDAGTTAGGDAGVEPGSDAGGGFGGGSTRGRSRRAGCAVAPGEDGSAVWLGLLVVAGLLVRRRRRD